MLGPEEVRERLALPAAWLSASSAVGLLGGGVIGGGWAARFLLNGVDVRLYDPHPQAERAHRRGRSRTRARAYGRLTLAPLPAEGTLTVVALGRGGRRAASSSCRSPRPSALELKQALLAAADRAASADTIICSSTSGLRPTDLQAGLTGRSGSSSATRSTRSTCCRSSRCAAASAPPPETVERAAARVRVGRHAAAASSAREIDGFIADRLLEALWREALWLVNDDVATVAEIDDAIRYGAGLRWAFMGTFLTYRIAGGEAGMRHFIAQFGPALAWPWTKLTDVPELTDELIDKHRRAVRRAGCRGRRCASSSGAATTPRRAPAGAARRGSGRRSDARPRGSAACSGRLPPPEAGAAGAPLRLDRRRVPDDWVDYNGHVHESRYLQVFADATDALLAWIGIDADYLAGGGSYFTAETHLSHLRQLAAGDSVR